MPNLKHWPSVNAYADADADARYGQSLSCITQSLHLFSFRAYLQLFHETDSLRPWLAYNIFSHSE